MAILLLVRGEGEALQNKIIQIRFRQRSDDAEMVPAFEIGVTREQESYTDSALPGM